MPFDYFKDFLWVYASRAFECDLLPSNLQIGQFAPFREEFHWNRWFRGGSLLFLDEALIQATAAS